MTAHIRRRRPVLAPALLLALLLAAAPLVPAGSAEDPEIDDPEGDEEVACDGTLCPVAQGTGDPPDFSDVDLLAAWVTENDATFAFVITATGDVQGDTGTTLSFTHVQDPDGASGSTGYEVVLTGGDLEDGAPNGTSAAVAGDTLTVTFDRTELSVSPGDLLQDLVVSRTRTEGQGSGLPQGDPEYTATDRAPDEGSGRDFVFQLPGSDPTMDVVIEDGRLADGDGAPCDQSGPCVATSDDQATALFDVRVQNTGAETDVFQIEAAADPLGATVDPTSLTLAPDEAETATLSVPLDGAEPDDYAVTVRVESGLGATAEATVTVVLQAADQVGIGTLGDHTITFIDAPTSATAGQGVTYRFEVTGPEDSTINIVDLVWDTAPHPDPAVADYPSFETDMVQAPPPYTAELAPTFAENGTYYLRGHAEIDGVGSLLTEEVEVTVAPPAAAGPRTSIVPGLDWLTPTAETTGFDSLFGRFAEVVLLGLLVLLLVLLVFLVMMLARTAWVEVEVRPRRRSVNPGESAEFQVRVKNRKKAPRAASANYTASKAWQSGLKMNRADGTNAEAVDRPGQSTRFEMTPRKEEGDHFEGTLRIDVPEDAAGEQADLDLNVIPYDDVDEAHPKRGDRAKVSVVAKGKKPRLRRKGKVRPRIAEPGTEAPEPLGPPTRPATVEDADGPEPPQAPPTPLAAGTPQVRLADVRHDPPTPVPGQQVETAARLRNDGDGDTRLRVVLMVAGEPVGEQRLALGARSEATVTFPWTAQSGDNRVRVRVFKV